MATFRTLGCCVMVTVAAISVGVRGANPLVPRVGMADPNLHYFNDGSGKFRMFATHDFSINNTGFLMKDWWTWSSDDLITWKLDAIVQPNVSVKWSTESERNECWATDAAYTNGKYYFYLSVGPSAVGVVTASQTQGPWTDPLGKPLLDSTLGKSLNPSTTFRDPCVFLDDDGEYYIIAGVFNYYITKLNKDMISLAEAPHYVVVNNPYGPCGFNHTDDKPFIHKENGTYYLSWGCFYATSTSIYGPYDTQGSVISTALIAPDFRIGDDVYNSLVGVAPPKPTDPLWLSPCPSGASTTAHWSFKQSVIKGYVNIYLTAYPDLCVTSDESHQIGSVLRVDKCSDSANQQFNFTTTSVPSSIDIQGPTCPCWNVNDFHARTPGLNRTGMEVQCFSCVDGSNFNPNQRFTVGDGFIRTWSGYAEDECVAVNVDSVPPPPPPVTPWYLKEDYTDRHGSFLQHNGQWYYASNDRSHSGDIHNPGVFRDTVVCYIHFRANNTMAPCIINGTGVGQYDANDGRWIEAENFFDMTECQKIDQIAHGGGDGFSVESKSTNGSLVFPHISGIPQNCKDCQLRLRIANGASDTTVHVKAQSGKIQRSVAKCSIPATGGLSEYREVLCDIDMTESAGEVLLNFTFEGVVRLDKFAILK